MELNDEEARQQANELIALADEILARPGPHAEAAARLEARWLEITGGEEVRPERETAARARAAELIAKADEALAQPRADQAESERRWNEIMEGKRARDEEAEWLASREKGNQSQPKPQRRTMRASDAITRGEFDEVFDALMGAMAKSINIERALWREELGKLEIRLNALEQGIRNAG